MYVVRLGAKVCICIYMSTYLLVDTTILFLRAKARLSLQLFTFDVAINKQQ